MSINNNFHIIGYGYLHDLNFNGNKPMVRIQRSLPNGITEESEDIWFNCTIADDLKNSLVNLHPVVKANKAVLLHFSLKYRGFSMSYSGQTPEDAAQIVIFHAELMKIHGIFVNGVKHSQYRMKRIQSLL